MIRAVLFSLCLWLSFQHKAKGQDRDIIRNGAYIDSLQGINPDGTNSNVEQQIRYGRPDSAKAARRQNNSHVRQSKVQPEAAPPKHYINLRDTSKTQPPDLDVN